MSSRLLVLPLVVATLTLLGCDDESPATDAGQMRDAAAATDAGSTGLTLSPDLCDDPANLQRIDMSNLTSGSGPSYGTINVAQAMRMIAAPTAGPFYMVNLIRFRDRAVYADGRQTNLTGEEANALYSPLPYLSAIGARPVFIGGVSEVAMGMAGEWDQVAIVEYPCPLALFAMSADPGFQAASVHKDAGLEASIVMVTHLSPGAGGTLPSSTFPPTMMDPSFQVVHALRYRADAMYQAGAMEPTRTGREAMALYTMAASGAEQTIGIAATARFVVEGVFIGDGRAFDEIWIDYMPSRAGYDAFQADSARMAAEYHRDAALEHGYSVLVTPLLSNIPGAPSAP